MSYLKLLIDPFTEKTIISLFLVSFIFFYCSAQTIPNLDMIKDVAVHEGYRVKYSFKDHRYLDVELMPNHNLSDWLAVTVTKSQPDSNRLSLHTYDGKDLNEIDSINAHLDIGNCKQIRSIVQNQLIFLLVSKCSKSTQSVDVIVVDPQTLSLTKLQALKISGVEDAQFWNNIYNKELNLIIISRSKQLNSSPSVIYHLVFKEADISFEIIDMIETVDGRSASVFNIEDRTYVAVSNYRDFSGYFANSMIYVQDTNEGKLMKYQVIKSKGIISFTYFCNIGNEKTEHFLLAANNRHLKGSPDKQKKGSRNKLIEESILYKWESGYFYPFQTLLVRMPSPWIVVPSFYKYNSLILLTWSYRDGIVSYQYDGWKYRRTALRQKDILNTDKPNFAILKSVSIAGETVFTIFTNTYEARRKFFFVPIFKGTKARADYEKNIDWCNNTLTELKLTWRNISSHYNHLSQISNEIESPEAKIRALFDLLLGYNSGKKYNSGLEIMSQQGIPTYNFMRSHSQEPPQCKIMDTKKFEFSKFFYVIPLKDGIISLEDYEILFYPVISKNGLENTKGRKLYSLKGVDKIFQFHLVNFCNHEGIYIEGIKKGKIFGRIYKIKTNYKLLFKQSLAIPGESNVRGLCTKNHRDCVTVAPKNDPEICSLYCDKIIQKYQCNRKSQEHEVYWNNYTIEIDSNVIKYSTSKGNENNYISTELMNINRTSQVFTEASDQFFVVTVITNGDIEVCKLNKNRRDSDVLHECKTIETELKSSVYTARGFIQNEKCIFIASNQIMNMYMLSLNYVMSLNLGTEEIKKDFEHFSIKSSNFILFRTDRNTIIIQYKTCKPS